MKLFVEMNFMNQFKHRGPECLDLLFPSLFGMDWERGWWRWHFPVLSLARHEAQPQGLQRICGEVWSPQRDAGPWIRFCPGAHHMQAQTAKRRIVFFRDAWHMLVEQEEATGLDERMAFALLPALAGGPVRRTMYQRDADLSPDTAMRDIKAMVRTGWLLSHGQARGRYYTAGPAMDPVKAEMKTITKPLRNPYSAR